MTREEIIDDHNITSDPDEIVEEMRRMENAGVTRLIVNSYCGDSVDTIRAFETEILSAFSD